MNENKMLKINAYISHYNHNKYWKMKMRLQDNSVPSILRWYYAFRLKRMEAFNCASLGTRVSGGSYWKSPPHLPHGIKGIFIAEHARIGSGVTIFQQVTVGLKDYKNGEDKTPVVGDDVTIGAGAKILGPISIGKGSIIGANAVVVKDVPEGVTVVGNPARIVDK